MKLLHGYMKESTMHGHTLSEFQVFDAHGHRFTQNLQGSSDRLRCISLYWSSISRTLIMTIPVSDSRCFIAPSTPKEPSNHSACTLVSTVLHLVCKQSSLRPTVLHIPRKGQLLFPAFHVLAFQKQDLRPVWEERPRVHDTGCLRLHS